MWSPALSVWLWIARYTCRGGCGAGGLQLSTAQDLLPPLTAFEEAFEVEFRGRSVAQAGMKHILFPGHGLEAPVQLGNMYVMGDACVWA